MSLGITKGTVRLLNITVSGSNTNFPAAGTGQTQIAKSNTKAGTTITAGTGLLLHTVTGGKTFYLSSMNLTEDGAGGGGWDIRDNTAIAGTPIIAQGMTNQAFPASVNMVFPVPIKFTTGVFLDLEQTGSVFWSIQGFEQ